MQLFESYCSVRRTSSSGVSFLLTSLLTITLNYADWEEKRASTLWLSIQASRIADTV